MHLQQIDRRCAAVYIFLAGLCVALVNWKMRSFSPDLSALYMAARFFAEGQHELVYAHPAIFFGGTPPEWLPHLPRLGLEGEEPLPYLYPPLWVALFAPLAGAVGVQTFFQIFGVLLIAVFAASVPLAWRAARSFGMAHWLWALLVTLLLLSSVVTFISMMHLQIQILVTFLVILAFERKISGRSATAGGVLALAAALKLAPAAFVLLFVLERDWRATKSFVAVGGALGLTSLALGGVELHFAMFEALGAASAALWVSAVTLSMDVVLYAGAGLIGLTSELDMAGRNFLYADTHLAVELLGRALALAALGWMLWRTAPLPPEQRVILRLVLFSLILNVFGPLGWAHYYLVQMMFLPVLLCLVPGPRGAALFCGFALLTSWPMVLAMRQSYPGDIPPILMMLTAIIALFVALVPRAPRRAATAAPQPAE